MIKLCSICKTYKSKEDFHNNKSQIDGLGSWCKECSSKYYSQRNKNKKMKNQMEQTETEKRKTIIREYVEKTNEIPQSMGTQDIEKWWDGCKNYYLQNKNPNIMSDEEWMKNKIDVLNQAHSRNHNELQNLKEDFDKFHLSYEIQISDLKNQIKDLQNPLSDVEAVKEKLYELPERLIHNNEYVAVVSEVINAEGVKWNGKDYCNWELKLFSKDEKFYAFCPCENIVEFGSRVRFTYTHPVQLKKLRVLPETYKLK
jgi:HD-GYP domain-containing protein (c-di-GMP phosphodiesterase class II)